MSMTKSIEQLRKELKENIVNFNLNIVRTIPGAGAPVILNEVIKELRLNTHFEVESPSWFDFKSLGDLYANENDSKVDMCVYVLDSSLKPAACSILEAISFSYSFKEIRNFIDKNKSVKVLVLVSGITLSDLRDDDDYVLLDFHKAF